MTQQSSSSSPQAPRLAPGDRLDRYEVVALLGVGGMGEVYRAHDPQLARDVALKVLLRRDARAEDLERFSREARAAGSLNHPNIVAVYDVGTHGEVPYVVTELLEGETLRARLDHGPLPLRKAIDYGVQIAHALAAAHAKRIWHRDVKPANVFVTQDGRVKLLDFGIAKLMSQRTLRAKPDDITGTLTEASAVMGTAGYMAPEQVLSQAVDHRADIFGLGAVLYEMFTGARPFKRSTKFETMRAVLDADPADPVSLNPDLSPMAADIVRRCLEKNPEERFQSARDLAFALQQVGEGTGTTGRLVLRRRRGDSGRLRWGLGAALVLAVNAALWLLTAGPPARPTYKPLTSVRPRVITSARFAFDDRSVVYSGAQSWTGVSDTGSLWRLDLDETETQTELGDDYAIPSGVDVLSTRAGDLALLLDRRFVIGERFIGTLALARLDRSAPDLEMEDVEGADWGPGGELAVVRSGGTVDGTSWLEYEGTTLHETPGSLRFPRVSRDGQFIAFVVDETGRGAGGRIFVVDTAGGEATPLTENYESVRGLAWSTDDEEIWFSAASRDTNRSIRAVTRRGREREVWSITGSATLWDIGADGTVLISSDEDRRFTAGMAPGETIERDFSWQDDTGVADVSPDGRTILFGAHFQIFLRRTDERPPEPLGGPAAFADALSPDGKMVVATSLDTRELIVVPVGPGPRRTVAKGEIATYHGARWFPDSQRILFSGKEEGRGLRGYIQNLAGNPLPLTPEGTWGLSVSHDGTRVAAIGTGQGISIWPVDGGSRHDVPNTEEGDRPVAWHEDGESLWVFRRDELPAPVYRVWIESGERELWRELMPSDVNGVYTVGEFVINRRGDAYFYSYKRRFSELYLVRLPQ